MKFKKFISVILVAVTVLSILPLSALLATANEATAPIEYVGHQITYNDDGTTMDVRLVAIVSDINYNSVGFNVSMTDKLANAALAGEGYKNTFAQNGGKDATVKTNTKDMCTDKVYSYINVGGATVSVEDYSTNNKTYTVGTDYFAVMVINNVPCQTDWSIQVTPYLTKASVSTNGTGATTLHETVALSLADNYTLAADVTAVTIGSEAVTVSGNMIAKSELASLTAGKSYAMTVTTAEGTKSCTANVYDDVIYTAKELREFNQSMSASTTTDGYYALGNDITASGAYVFVGWSFGEGESVYLSHIKAGNPGVEDLQNQSSVGGGFRGVFDGRGYAIKNFGFRMGGMFGDLQTGATVKNLKITGATIGANNQQYSGILASGVYGCTIENCRFEGSVATKDGGLLANLVTASAMKNVTLVSDASIDEVGLVAYRLVKDMSITNVTAYALGTCSLLEHDNGEESHWASLIDKKVVGTMSAMTYNLRYDAVQDTSKAEAIVTQILEKMPDTIGVQEAKDNWLDYLENSTTGIGEYYTCIRGKHREQTNNYIVGDDEYNAIFYKTDKFIEVESGTKWLYDGNNDGLPDDSKGKLTDSKDYRILTYAVLQRKADNEKILVVNTHLDNQSGSSGGHTVRVNQATYLLNFLNRDKYSGMPIICTGDFNSKHNDTTNPPIYGIMTGEDTRLGDPMTIVPDVVPTVTHPDANSIIDYCFVSEDLIFPTEYKVLPQTGSDHCPVYIEYHLYYNPYATVSASLKASTTEGSTTQIDFLTFIGQ